MIKINDSNLKINFLFLILSIIAISGCKKEDEIDLSMINDVVGVYEGQYNHESGWVLYNPTITKSADNSLQINYWPSGGDSITLKINANNLEIEKQTFDLEEHSLAQGHLYYYKLRLSACGSFENDKIEITFTEEIKIEGESEFKHKNSGTVSIIKQ